MIFRLPDTGDTQGHLVHLPPAQATALTDAVKEARHNLWAYLFQHGTDLTLDWIKHSRSADLGKTHQQRIADLLITLKDPGLEILVGGSHFFLCIEGTVVNKGLDFLHDSVGALESGVSGAQGSTYIFLHALSERLEHIVEETTKYKRTFIDHAYSLDPFDLNTLTIESA